MTSPSDDAWIGCSIPAEKGRYFVQLVTSGALFERKVLASSFGVSHDDALDKAMRLAGVTAVKGEAQIESRFIEKLTGMAKAHSTGIMTAILAGEFALEGLTNAIGRLLSETGKRDGVDPLDDPGQDPDPARERVQDELFDDL